MNTSQPQASSGAAASPDATLVQYIQQGFSKALDRFYLAHRTEFFKWAGKNFGLDQEHTVDLYQDAIIILYENVRSGKFSYQHASLKTYLFAIGKNLIHSYLRRQQRELANRSVLHREWLETGATGSLPEDPSPYPHALDELASAIGQIPERGQRLIHLFYFDKQSLKQITGVLGYRNEDVVKSTKLRYLRNLRGILQERMAQNAV